MGLTVMKTFKEFLIESDSIIEQVKKSLHAEHGNLDNGRNIFDIVFRNFPDGNVPDEIQNELLKTQAFTIQILEYIKNPSKELQLGVFKLAPSWIGRFSKIDHDILKVILTDNKFILRYNDIAINIIKKEFANNQILMNKWLRYVETVYSD